ncbi:unnamed protein product, partial [Musa acuminata subsp. burmannicoides]
SRGLGAVAARFGSGRRGSPWGVPRGLAAAEHGGSGRPVGSAARVARSGRQLRHSTGKRRRRLLPAHRSGRELGPTPPTIELEKDVEGV